MSDRYPLICHYVCNSVIDLSRIFELAYLKLLLRGGLVFYGGLIGGIIGVGLAGLIHKCDVGLYVSQCIGCLPIAHAFGRIGCLTEGCCYGIPYEGPLAAVYENSIAAPSGISLFPVQLLEAVINLIIAAVLTAVVIKTRASRIVIPLYGLMYGISRFLLEYLRYDLDERGGFLMFSTSQWISLALVLCSVVVMIYIIKKRDPA